MKRKDLMIIGAIGFIAAMIAFVVSNTIFGTPSRNPIKVPVVYKIDPSFPDVESDNNYTSFLNKQALNPTQLIQIGNNNNTTPFHGQQ